MRVPVSTVLADAGTFSPIPPTMTVSELISRWTQEDRGLHAELVLECLERERSLIDIQRKIKTTEADLKQKLNIFISELNNLAQTANESASQIENIHLLLAHGEGNA